MGGRGDVCVWVTQVEVKLGGGSAVCVCVCVCGGGGGGLEEQIKKTNAVFQSPH